MGLGSQQGQVDALSGITGLVHEIFTGDVLPSVRWESISAQLMMNASEGDYRYDGESLNGATDLDRPVGAMGSSSGYLPDSAHTDAANWQTTPVRRYVRRAVDNFVEAAAIQGPGSFADFGTRMFDQMWGAFRLMEIRHAVGSSNGYLCKVSSRTNSTSFVVTAGYNHTGMNPCIMLDKGMVIGWIDIDDSNTEAGAGTISVLAPSTNTVTVTTGATWEPGNTLGAGDFIVAATTPNISTDYFDTEYQAAKNGLMDIVDPNASLTTVFNIAEATYPRWKPFRASSSTFDHIELTEFFQKHEAKSTAPVTNDTHTALCQGAVYAELARTLEGYQQSQQLGKTLEGGYTSIRVAQHDIAVDPNQLQNLVYNICMEDIYTVSLVEAGYFDEDGSMYNRISDFDGKEWFVRDYCNSFSPRRNRHGALTGITLNNVTSTDFDPVPNY